LPRSIGNPVCAIGILLLGSDSFDESSTVLGFPSLSVPLINEEEVAIMGGKGGWGKKKRKSFPWELNCKKNMG